MLENTILNPSYYGRNASPAQGQGMPNADDPSIPVYAYWVQAARWNDITPCVEGNHWLSHHAQLYLPQLKAEKDPCYARRLSIAAFTPYFNRIIAAAAGLLLRKRVELIGGDEAYWDEWRQDVDRHGSSLEQFLQRHLRIALAYGHCSMLADFPQATGIRSMRDEYAANLRPYLMNVEPWRLIGWRVEEESAGARLLQARIREIAVTPRGTYGEDTWHQIRVLEPGGWQILRASQPRETTGDPGTAVQWDPVPGPGGSGRTRFNYIPLSTTYTGKICTLVSEPPLLDVATLNLRHYRLQSKQLHALEVAGFPILALTGWDDTSSDLDVDVTSALSLEMGGSASYVEPASSSFKAMREELDSLAQQMSNLGITILAQQKMVGETAKAKQLDRADSNSLLATISMNLEAALQQAVDTCAAFARQAPPTVSLDRDFDLQALEPQGIGAIQGLFTSGLIDRETALELLQRGEVLPDAVLVDEIMLRTEEEEAKKMEKEQESMAMQTEMEMAKAANKEALKPMPQASSNGKHAGANNNKN